jgi:prevent-host-death family protein
MTTVNIHQAKTTLSRLIEQAQNGEEVVLAKAGKPVARIVPFVTGSAPRKPGILRGKLWISTDFDAPLPADLRKAFGVEE